MDQPKVNISILNYNGEDLLRSCIPTIQRAIEKSSYSCTLTVLDNQSEDGSENVVLNEFKNVSFEKAADNLVYCSYNDYFEKSKDDIIIILNNDMKVEEDFIDPLIDDLIKDKDTFFAAPKVTDLNGKCIGHRSKFHLKYGLPWGPALLTNDTQNPDKKSLTMQTGFGAFWRTKLLKLNGYDDLFLPGTLEDSDLCFRAYRRGWKGVYVPESVVSHVGQVSFKKAFGEDGVKRINRRNLYLFVWKNIRNRYFILQHILWIPVHLVKYLFSGQWYFLKGFSDALKLFSEAMNKRKKTRVEKSVRQDHEIFEISKSL